MWGEAMNEDPRTAWKRGATLEEIAGNPDGTFNGALAMSAISGLDQREIQWMFDRMKELVAAGVGPEESKRIVHEEGASKPWLNSTQKSE
jgi:hypothetical protein